VRLPAVHNGHLQIQDDDIGTHCFDFLDAICPFSLATYLPIRVASIHDRSEERIMELSSTMRIFCAMRRPIRLGRLLAGHVSSSTAATRKANLNVVGGPQSAIP